MVVQPFRTAKEAINLANNTLYGLGASVWSEHIGLAMEVACNIKAGSVWINNHNVFDAATGFGGFKESGFGRDGGKEVSNNSEIPTKLNPHEHRLISLVHLKKLKCF